MDLGILLNLGIFVIAFFILVKAADYFVKAASSIAKNLGVSDFVIGLTIVAIGTSISELASSISAVLNGSPGIVLGNIIGSNVANVALIIGIAAVFCNIKKSGRIAILDGYIMLLITTIFLLILLDYKIGFYEGLIFVFIFIIYNIFLFEGEKLDKRSKKREFKDFVTYVFLFRYLNIFTKKIDNKKSNKTKINTISTLRDVFLLLMSGVGIVYGAKYLIGSAKFFAQLFGMSDVFIGLTIIAIGTSLPELSVTIAAIRKGLADIAIGNIIGSNIANILLVGGLSSMVGTIAIFPNTFFILMFFMFISSIAFIMLLKYRGIDRNMGILFLLFYCLFLGTSFFV